MLFEIRIGSKRLVTTVAFKILDFVMNAIHVGLHVVHSSESLIANWARGLNFRVFGRGRVVFDGRGLFGRDLVNLFVFVVFQMFE